MAELHINDYPDYYHNKAFLPLLKDQTRILLLCGGAGSGKSHFAALKFFDRVVVKEDDVQHRLLMVRKTKSSLRKSSFQLFKDKLNDLNVTKYFTVNRSHLDFEYKYNGSQILSTGLDDPEKLKSIEKITGIWVEEATELTAEDFRHLNMRMRGEIGTYKQIILSFNPIDARHWLKKEFFEIDPGKDVKIHYSLVDNNRFIDREYINVLDGLETQDRNMYNIYRKGLWGVREHVIYTNYEFIDDWPTSFDEVVYGLDFGFNNPTTLVMIGWRDKNVYAKELLYQTGLTNSQLIGKLEQLVNSKQSEIFADAAEPARIEEIRTAGFNIHPAKKSVSDGLDYCKRLRLHIDGESDNLRKEIAGYCYKKDKNDNVLDEPVKFMDHLMDGLRYALYSKYDAGPEAASVGDDPGPIVTTPRAFRNTNQQTTLDQITRWRRGLLWI